MNNSVFFFKLYRDLKIFCQMMHRYFVFSDSLKLVILCLFNMKFFVTHITCIFLGPCVFICWFKYLKVPQSFWQMEHTVFNRCFLFLFGFCFRWIFSPSKSGCESEVDPCCTLELLSAGFGWGVLVNGPAESMFIWIFAEWNLKTMELYWKMNPNKNFFFDENELTCSLFFGHFSNHLILNSW